MGRRDGSAVRVPHAARVIRLVRGDVAGMLMVPGKAEALTKTAVLAPLRRSEFMRRNFRTLTAALSDGSVGQFGRIERCDARG